MPFGGSVFVNGDSANTLYSVAETTGAVAWTQPIEGGQDSSPAVYGGSVFVSSACNEAYAFRATDGTPLWRYPDRAQAVEG